MAGSERYEHREEPNVAENRTGLSQTGLSLLTPSTAQAAGEAAVKKKKSINILKENKILGF